MSCSSGSGRRPTRSCRAHGVRISRRLELPPGRYQLRVGVRDGGSGATGSVLYDLDGPGLPEGAAVDERAALVASAPGQSDSDREPRSGIQGRAAGAARRRSATFRADDTLALFTEVYDNQTKVAHRVAIKTTVIADDGKVVHTAEDERKSEELQGAKGGYGYSTTIETKRPGARAATSCGSRRRPS